MFDIGFWELALLAVLALIVLGPKRLPGAARAAGRWVARMRGFVASVKQDLDRELRADELAELRRLRDELGEAKKLIQETSGEMVERLGKAERAADPDYLLKAIDDSARADKTPTDAAPPSEDGTAGENKTPAADSDTPADTTTDPRGRQQS